VLILIQTNQNNFIGGFMAGDVPTPDQAEQALFFIKWWKEFFIGLAAILGITATIKKGQKIPALIPVLVPITEKELTNRMDLCRHELKDEMHDDFRTIMHELKVELKEDQDQMFEKIELLIKVAKL